jgi:hypothetical protein
MEKRFSVSEEAIYRRLILPEEDRARLDKPPWCGGFRWFRSTNVICLEHYRVTEIKPASRLKAS